MTRISICTSLHVVDVVVAIIGITSRQDTLFT